MATPHNDCWSARSGLEAGVVLGDWLALLGHVLVVEDVEVITVGFGNQRGIQPRGGVHVRPHRGRQIDRAVRGDSILAGDPVGKYLGGIRMWSLIPEGDDA